jgi:hypothetical protein
MCSKCVQDRLLAGAHTVPHNKMLTTSERAKQSSQKDANTAAAAAAHDLSRRIGQPVQAAAQLTQAWLVQTHHRPLPARLQTLAPPTQQHVSELAACRTVIM